MNLRPPIQLSGEILPLTTGGLCKLLEHASANPEDVDLARTLHETACRGAAPEVRPSYTDQDLAGLSVDLKAEQALAILTALQTWGDSAKGRGFKAITLPDGRWLVTLLEVERRTAGGESLTDALAQIATSVAFEPIPG